MSCFDDDLKLDVDEEKHGDLKIDENAATGSLSAMDMHGVHTFSNRGVPSNSVLTNVFKRGHTCIQTPTRCFSHATVHSLCAQLLCALR
jgi:hypothetical protein